MEPSAPSGRIVERCAAAAFVIAIVALAGWVSGAHALAGQWDDRIPMAPSTALAIIGLSGGLFAFARWPAHGVSRSLALVGAGVAALLGGLVSAKLVLGFDIGIEHALAHTNELFGAIPLGRMSPLTATLLLLESAAMVLVLRLRTWAWAGVAATLSAAAASIIALIVLVGYAYGAPLLYGGDTIPVALPTSVAFLLMGLGQLDLAWPTIDRLKSWRGGSLRGRLLRAFLPGALLLVMVEGWIDHLFGPTRTVNPALWDSITALIVSGLIVAFTAWIARHIGDDLDDARDALEESESRTRAITDSAQDAILMMDPGGRLSYWNPAAERILGYSRTEAIGQLVHEFIVPSAYRERFAEAFPAFLRTGQGGAIGKTLDLEAVRKDGKHIPIQLSLSAVHLHDGWYGVGVVRDVTDQRNSEIARHHMEQRIQQTQKLESLGVLAGGIAHDFNNILTAVLGHADLALDEVPPSSPARASLTEIGTAARRAAELVRQMLAYSGKSSFALERVDLNELIAGMQRLLAASISKKAVLHVELEAGLPLVQADPGQVRQVVMALVTNSSEALGERQGEITIRTTSRHCESAELQTPLWPDKRPAGLYVQLEVADTGMGMDAVTQARVFEPFFTTKFTGRGLGLAATLGIVRAHKGVLTFASTPGRGTTFTALLPALDVADDASVAIDAAATPVVWQDHGTILLVDDEEQLRTLGARMLGRVGYTVLTAADGPDALAVYSSQQGQIDAVILDLTMPKMNGAEVFARLREIDPHVRVILASGFSVDDISARFPDLPLSGIVQKPYSVGVLRDALRHAMTRRP